MGNLNELSQFDATIPQIETDSVWVGGSGGFANSQGQALANRTKWLNANKQPLDATLTALAALVTAADKLLYSTGVDTFSTTTLTAFARTLLDDVDAATMRVTLGAAALASPTFTGVPAAPTAAPGTNTTQLATTAFTQAAIAALVASSPATLDTLNELAAALGDDPNFATTITNALAGKQSLDATLTALAAIVTATDKLIYATGVDTFATTTLTAFARTLLDDADAATARTTLGAQASDAALTALAAVVTAADKLIYATGVDTFSTTTLTAFARTLLDDADAATMRTTLGAIGASFSLGVNGYIIFPAWFAGGLVIQWGSGSPAANGENYMLPIAFPTAFWQVFTTSKGSAESVNTVGNTTSLTQVFLESTVASSSVSYLAIGN